MATFINKATFAASDADRIVKAQRDTDFSISDEGRVIVSKKLTELIEDHQLQHRTSFDDALTFVRKRNPGLIALWAARLEQPHRADVVVAP